MIAATFSWLYWQPLVLTIPIDELVFAVSTVLGTILILLHSPHDSIQAVAVSPGAPAEDVYVISRHNLLRSRKQDSWRRLHKGLGPYKLSSIVISPDFHHDATMFVGTLGGGVYRSEDRGQSWIQTSQGLSELIVIALEISPNFSDDGKLFALGRGGLVFRSRNRGVTWEPIAIPISHAGATEKFDSMNSKRDIVDPMIDAGVDWKAIHRYGAVSCMTIARDGIAVGLSSGSVYWSADDGDSWLHLTDIPNADRATCLEVPNGSAIEDTVYAGTESHGIVKIVSGRALPPRQSHDFPRHVTALVSFYNRQGDVTLLATSWDRALFCSFDQGATWQLQDKGLTTNSQADERRFGAPHFSAIAVENPQSSEITTWVGGFDGLFRSGTESAHWTPIATLPLGTIVGFDTARVNNTVQKIAVSTYGAGIYLSNWPTDTGQWQIGNRGLQTTRLGALAFSPEHEQDHTLFVACEGHVMRSNNEGLDWTLVPLIPEGAVNGILPRISSVLRSTERSLSKRLNGDLVKKLRTIYKKSVTSAGLRVNYFVFPTVFAFSPGFRTDGIMFVGTRAHGVFLSTDRGQSFSRIWDGEGQFVFSVIALPSPEQSLLLYVAISEGLYRSTDSGNTWKQIATTPKIERARLAASSSGILFAGCGSGLLRSIDSGDSWEQCPIDENLEAIAIDCVRVSPNFEEDETLIVNAVGAGIFISNDGGDSFRRVEFQADEVEPSFSPGMCFPDAAGLVQLSPSYSNDGMIVAAAGEKVWIIDTKIGRARILRKKTRYEDLRPEIDYQGRWTRVYGSSFSASGAHRSAHEGDLCCLSFTGRGIDFIGTRGPGHGIVQILIDGDVRQTIDLQTNEFEHTKTIAKIRDLEPGVHEIGIRVGRRQSGNVQDAEVVIEAFDVYG